MLRCLCLSLPLAVLLAAAGCCCTPEFEPGPRADGGPFFVPDAPFFRPDAGPIRDAAPLDAGAPATCSIELLEGALCEEPCVGPARRVTCDGGLQHLSVAALDDGTTWLSASFPPRLLHRVGETLEEHVLPLSADGSAVLLVDAVGGLRALYADETLAVGILPDPSGTSRANVASGRAFWVPVGAAIDSSDTLHLAWIDDGPALNAGAGGLDGATFFVRREVNPTYFADSALAVAPDNVSHVAFWQHRTPTSLGRDLMVRDGEGAAYPIGFHAEPNDDGTNVSLAAAATALVASLDFADGIHVLTPDDTVPVTAYRDVLVPGTAELAVTGCGPLPPPGPPGDGCEPSTCTETGAGIVRRAQEVVALDDGRFGLVWLERRVSRDVAREPSCTGAGCICRETTLSDASETDLVFGFLDEVTGVPARSLVLPLGDVVTSTGLQTAVRGSRFVVAIQDSDLTAVLVEIALDLLGP